MKVYPNPLRSISYVSVPSELKNGGNITITNKSGEIIERISFDNSEAEMIPINLSKEPNGMYKITLDNEWHEVSYDLLSLAQSSN